MAALMGLINAFPRRMCKQFMGGGKNSNSHREFVHRAIFLAKWASEV